MALNKQQIPLQFGNGIDTKTDEKAVVPTKLLELENAVFSKRGQLKKRFGYDILSNRILGTTSTIDVGFGVSSFNNELLNFDGANLYSYIQALDQWKLIGSASSVTVSNKSIVRDVYQQTSVDYAYNQGISVYVWEDSSGGSRFSVIDESTGAVVQDNILLSNTAEMPRVVGVGNFIYIYYVEGVNIQFRSIQITTPQTVSSALNIISTLDGTNKVYDVQKISDRAYISFNKNNGNTSIFFQTNTQAVSAEYELVGYPCTRAVCTTVDENDNIWIAVVTATQVHYAIRDYGLSGVVLVPTLVETISNVRNITSALTANSEVSFLYEVSNTSPGFDANFIKKTTATVSGSVGSPTVFVRSLGLASKTFQYNNQTYLTVAHQSTLQSTYFVYSLAGDIVTKIQQNVGGGYLQNPCSRLLLR